MQGRSFCALKSLLKPNVHMDRSFTGGGFHELQGQLS